MSKVIARHACEYSQWEALFLRVYIQDAYNKYGTNEHAHATYLLEKLSQYMLKNIQSCYIVLHYANTTASARMVSSMMIVPSIQKILHELSPLLREITVEIVGVLLTTAQRLAICTQIARHTMACSTQQRIVLRVCMDFDMFCMISNKSRTLQWWTNMASMQHDNRLNTAPSIHFALECTVQSSSQLKKYLYMLYEMPWDIQQLAVHLSIDYSVNAQPVHIDELRNVLKAHGMYPYQYWHYVRDKHEYYISHYLETVFFLRSYIGLKLYNGIGNTISWMQGDITHTSAVGTYTTTNTWKIMSPDEEIALRIAQGDFGMVYIPSYLYGRLGKKHIQNAIYTSGLRQVQRHIFVKR